MSSSLPVPLYHSIYLGSLPFNSFIIMIDIRDLGLHKPATVYPALRESPEKNRLVLQPRTGRCLIVKVAAHMNRHILIAISRLYKDYISTTTKAAPE